jgi:hypothetical protein
VSTSSSMGASTATPRRATCRTLAAAPTR